MVDTTALSQIIDNAVMSSHTGTVTAKSVTEFGDSNESIGAQAPPLPRALFLCPRYGGMRGETLCLPVPCGAGSPTPRMLLPNVWRPCWQ